MTDPVLPVGREALPASALVAILRSRIQRRRDLNDVQPAGTPPILSISLPFRYAEAIAKCLEGALNAVLTDAADC